VSFYVYFQGQSYNHTELKTLYTFLNLSTESYNGYGVDGWEKVMVQYDSEKYFQHSIKRSETTDKENGPGRIYN
jgi:hypothetical protein